jgi:hypothetical protein
MLNFAVIENQITGSAGEYNFSIPFTQEAYDGLVKVQEEFESVKTMDEFNDLLENLKAFTTQDLQTVIETECPYIKVDPKNNNFYLHYNDVTSDVKMPKALVDRLMESHEKGIDYMPLIKMWVRFLRNPNLPKKGGRFARKFFNFVNMTYVHPKLYIDYIAQGYSDDIATKKATVYQMKITKEGLLNGYKVSREILHKFEASEDGQSAVQKPRYQRTFDPNTGEITSDGLPEIVEDRLFEPAVMGSGGDAFSCTGANGFPKPGHFIKVGCVHALDSWDQVNTNDDQSCVKGLHVGGLYYISGYSGEIHNVFIDPMHVGAVPDDSTGAIRCKQYFVHSSLAGVNGSIYHSSEYAKMTDFEWQEMLVEALKMTAEKMSEMNAASDKLQALK